MIFRNFKTVCVIIFLITIFSGCKNFRDNGTDNGSKMDQITFREIPGITSFEIGHIEDLKQQNVSFIYGMIPSSETFVEYGETRGFTAHFCEWLSNLFEIPFFPVIYEWSDLVSGLESLEIDFTGELTLTDERRQTFYMTDPIARRSIKYVRLAGSTPIHNITVSRAPSYAFFDGAITKDYVDRFTPYSFYTYLVDSYEEAYNLLVSGQIDAFFDDSSMGAVFDIYENLIYNDFVPVIDMPVSLSTRNFLLEPIISVVQKALNNGASAYLAELYDLGRQEDRRHRLYVRLNEEEREFLRDSPVIPFAAEFYNYPISFYSKRDRQWQGIYFDILDELSSLTGLNFELKNSQDTPWPELLDMLESGEAYFISELLPSEERAGRFLWPSVPLMTDNYALLSKSETPNVTINEVFNVRVGLAKSTAYSYMFNAWFPLHTNTFDFDSSDDAFNALDRGDIDMVISSQRRLLSLTNYYELSGYKANLTFVYTAESYIGFNREQDVLCSIIDKALNLIDVNGISSRWASQTFDYQARLLQAQRPWLIGAIVLSFMVLSLMSVLFARSRSAGKRLDILVRERTAELEIATEAANNANRSKSSFLANMSHEIRTPMNTILGVTEIMLQTEPIESDTGQALNKIYNSCDMLMGIINDILDFSKIEAGKLDIKPYEYYIASLINDSIHLNMMRIGDKPIEFIIKVDENIPAKLLGDELRIKQILNNLLSNAFKYTNEGVVTLSVSSQPLSAGQNSKEGVTLSFSVKDTGQGMTPDQVEKLFDEYSRFNEESGRTIEGTGLGLSITQRLVNLMNGEILVESESGTGTVFTVHLPQGTVDSEILGRELAASLQQFRMSDMLHNKRSQITRDPMPYGKVLVVDDVEANLYVAEGLLKPYKLQIETVMSGFAAIEKINEGNDYDIVFMDHMMPDMDGIETVNLIRLSGYTSPIVALTANAVAGQADLFLENGFDNFISKPIDIRQLNNVLNKLVRDKQPEEVIEAARIQSEKPDSLKDVNPILQDLLNKVKDYVIQGKFEEAEQAISFYAEGLPLGGHDSATMHLMSANIDGLDIVQGLEKFNGDVEIYFKLLRSYTSSISALYDLLDTVNEETLIDYQRAVHSIKGTSLDIFAEPVGIKAAELEEAAKQKKLDYIKKENPSFIENVRQLIYDIEEMLSASEPVNARPMKDRIDIELLSKLLSHCEDYDMAGVDNVMTEIEKYQYETDEGLSAWLRKNVDVVDFNGIAERISGLISKST